MTHSFGLRLVAHMAIQLSEKEFLSWEAVGESKEALWRHTLTDGRVFDEAIQYADTQTGRVLIALKDQNGKWLEESLWSERSVEFAKKLDALCSEI